jgi:putative ABC transport system substrate-binding protein
VKDDLTIPAMKESGIDPATVTQYCFSELRDVPRLMRQVVDSKPDVLVIFASAVAVRIAHEASPSLPIVFGDVQDPVKNGLATSLSHPGMNMTGVTSNTDELLGKRIELLKSAFPYVTRLGVLGNPANEGQLAYLRVAHDAARAINIETRLYAVESQPQLAMAFAAMTRDGMQAVLPLPDAWFFPHRFEIASLVAKERLPMMFSNTAFVAAGGLLMYGPNLSAIALKTWTDAQKILRGAKASELPIEQPTEFDFVVNAKAARDQGLTVSPAAMLRVTRVIE